MAKEEFEVTDLSKIENERIKNKIASFMEAKAMELKRNYQLEVLDRIDEMFSKKFLRYGKILKINKDKLTDLENSFILPVFIKPGRTHFMLRTPEDKKIKQRIEDGHKVRCLPYQRQEDARFKFFYNRHIVAPREEKVPLCK